MTVAALYVDAAGPYASMEGVDWWDAERDAALYAGPFPAVAHPPCGPWGQLRWNCKYQRPDLGPIGVRQLRKWGGVLEHPRGSLLWPAMGLPRPYSSLPALVGHEWALEVDQCDWGHRAQKRTWLAFFGVQPCDLPPIPPKGTPTHTIGTNAEGRKGRKCLPKGERHLTPPSFATWLVQAVRNYQKRTHQSAA